MHFQVSDTDLLVVQSLSGIWLFVTPLQHARLPCPSPSPGACWHSYTELVMPFKHLILFHPLLWSSIFPGIRVFSNELVFCIRWPKYRNLNFSISPSNEYSGLISFRVDRPPKSLANRGAQFSSVAQLCLTLCDPVNRSTPGLPVHHQLPEFTQTHVHWVSDAIQPSHPLLSSSPPAPNRSQHQGLFQWVNSSHEVAKVLEFQLQHQSFQWTRRIDLV